jgi:hypothetical protein
MLKQISVRREEMAREDLWVRARRSVRVGRRECGVGVVR